MKGKIKRRLPGIRFRAEPPVPEDTLPRMDIAAFVGFASSGPIDTPVPVEDMVRFREIFGDDLPLAREPSTGEMLYAYLAPAVEAFFKNGGKRCWVVRAAGAAETNRFRLNGLVRADNVQPALALARSEGRWSDKLQVDTFLSSGFIKVTDLQCSVGSYSLDLKAGPEQVQIGDLIQFEFECSDKILLLYLAVDSIKGSEVKGKLGGWFEKETPPGKMDEAAAISDWQLQCTASPPKEITAKRLTFDILVREGEALTARLSRLGFYKKHARFWADLPVDSELYSLKMGRLLPGRAATQELQAEAATPRFPLAGPSEPAELYLPLSMIDTFSDMKSKGVYNKPLSENSLEREGLATFDSGIFLDTELADVGALTLIGELNHKLYLREEPEPLKGIHSLLPVDEVTLLSVPDAVHRGWQEKDKSLKQIPGAPLLQLETPEIGQTEAGLFWSEPGPDAIYTLQESREPLFEKPVTIYQGKESRFPVAYRDQCPDDIYYRVNARVGECLSPWSNTLDLYLTAAGFSNCSLSILTPPLLEMFFVDSPPGHEFELEWTHVEGADRYVLQESCSPDFTSSSVIYDGNGTSYQVRYRGDGPCYYRVCSKGGTALPWSNTCIYRNPSGKEWLVNAPEDYVDNELLIVHQALLRFCAGRGDLFALLSLPHHYRDDDSLKHVKKVAASAKGNEPGYGALYHPWLYMGSESDEEGGTSRYVPPDGAVCGTMAMRAVTRGAWIAPANEPLQGVSALQPVINAGDWQELFNNQVNVIRENPRGFLLLSADTLSDDYEQQPINVRRLLILLRRLALREGMTYVFQPNNIDFRRRVQQRFERLLARMYAKGAFAGKTPETSYRVVTDSSVNTTAGLEQGRFIVELRVAPSLPMSFITVRLVQTHEEGMSILEV